MKKKIIIVTGKDIDVEELEEDIPNLKMRREEDDGFEYSQVSNESGECLLSKKLVSFQGSSEKTSLSLLVVAEDEEKQLELRNKLKHIIDSEILVKLIKDKEFRVGNFVEENKVLSDIYIERQLENDKTHEVIHEKDLVRISNRVVIIIDEAGSGKSTLMNSLTRNLKEAYPNIWVCRINLINYSEIFFKEVMLRKDGKKSYSPGEEESTLNFFIDTLLDSQPVTKLKTPFDKSLFRLALQGYMKLFLVFDGFDEICPNYKDVVLELLFSLHQLKFEKLYITSRKNENTSPIKIPEGAYLKNVPLTTEQQMQFLVDYWAKEANVEDEKTVVKLREIATKSRGKIGVTIIKNPLMLLLTAEYLKDAITIMCKEPDQVSISFQYALFLTHRNRKMNFIEVCRSFIEKKIIIYQIDKSKQSLGNISSENKHYYFINAVQSVHTYLALIAIFGQEEALKMNRDMPDVNDEYIRIELPKIGLVYEQGNTFQFIHRTFTDFFVTEFIRGHPKKCAPVMETFVKDLPYSWWDAVFEYITDGWFDCSNINREVIDRIKYVLTYIALVRRFRKQTTIELTGDEGPNIEDIKDELLSLGLLKEGRRKSRNWEGLSFVYWRMADYFVKNFIDMHRAEALTVSNYNHADKMERFFKWEE